MGTAALLLLPYWLVQGVRHGKYLSNLRERLGLAYPALEGQGAAPGGAIWLHAVSVGEVLSGVPLARQLKERYPERRLIVSTTTLTGHAMARQRMPFADAVIYFPLDWDFAVRRAFRAVKPGIVVILETEIWPNFLREAERRGVPVVFLSGRVSLRSFARFQRWIGRAGFLLRPLLRSALAIPAAFLMQTEEDAERIRALGAPAERVRVNGNLKYDQELPQATPLAGWLAKELNARGRRPVFVAGSVVAHEEPLALIAFGTAQGEHSRAFLVLAPRKPERFEPAADFIRESHRKFLRRSELAVPAPGAMDAANSGAQPVLADDVTVLLLDSIGELASLYALADVVFVGGSLVPSGGHNIIEPAAFGKIPVFGPHTENFAEMTGRFIDAGAAIRAESPEDVGVAWIDLLKNPEKMKEMGAKAKRAADESRGATARAMGEIERILEAEKAAGAGGGSA
jgi:3-deoxy-D-manno-octulosonic-acid transferase